jgi:bifunctional DNA-binding transcriptional regulator/antitoxin component of YhaV-PrlF toxin-antitoxin module
VKSLPTPMMRVLRPKTELVVPPSVRRLAGIKAGDQLEFTASEGVITIKAVALPTSRSVRAELAAIRGVEAGINGGACVTLTDLLHGLDQSRRTSGAKAARRLGTEGLQSSKRLRSSSGRTGHVISGLPKIRRRQRAKSR